MGLWFLGVRVAEAGTVQWPRALVMTLVALLWANALGSTIIAADTSRSGGLTIGRRLSSSVLLLLTGVVFLVLLFNTPGE